MKNLYKYVFLMLVVVAASVKVFAQADVAVVRGKITDSKTKRPVHNVSVTEIDKDDRIVKGVSTDNDGNYAIKISNPKNKISVSYIGYKTTSIEIKGRTTINITMDQVNNDLDEVVITVQKKTDNGLLPVDDRNLTTSLTKINAKDLEEMQAASIDQALQGRLAGVDITASSGDPGAGMSIRIRGTSSINAASNPLIVVDGLPFETSIPSDFNFGTADDQGYAQLLNIAPSDIKEISVLKDAAATALWGSRAANGVLIITTKRGTISKPVISYTFRSTIAKQPDPIPLLNGDQYSTLISEMVQNRTGTPLNTLTAKEFAYDINDPYWYYNYSNNTDWLAAITRTGITQDHNVSLSGGGEKARYFVSLGYFNQKGTTIGTDLDRINARINLDYNVSDRLRFRTDISYTYTDNPRNYATNIRNVAINKMPNMSIYEYNELGVKTPNYFSPAVNIQGQYPNTYNPVALANAATNNIVGNRVIPTFNVQYQMIPRKLTLTADLRFDINNTKNKTFLPQIATGRPTTETVVNRAFDGDVDGFNVQSKVSLVYTPTLPKKHNVTSLLSIFTSDYRSLSYQALTSNTASSELQDPSIPSRTQNQELGLSSGFGQSRSVSALINATYIYNDKYILNGGLRGDGNSRFGPENRYGLFPSVSARWRVSSEKFMKSLKFINDLSVRGGYGQSGNAPSKDYTFYNQYSNFNYNYLGQSGVYPSTLELKNLKWEVIHGVDLGFNLIMLKNRVNIDVDLYKRKTRDLFFPGLQISSLTGFDNVDMNVGVLDNDGWDVNILTTPYKSKNFNVDFNFNISHNENVIREISEFYPQSRGNLTANGQYLSILQIDNPFGSFYGYRYKGVYADEAATVARDASGKPIFGPNGQGVFMRFNYPNTDYLFKPGDAMYEDINHDGNIDYKDVVYLGNSNPKLSGGFGFTFSYKANWKLSTFFSYRTGYQIVNGTKMTTTNQYNFNNQSTATLRRWRNPGDVTDIPRALWNSGYNWLGSDRYVEDASFMRFRSTTLRYNFSQSILKKLKIKSFSAYITGENLFTLTKYTGQDPEVTSRGQGVFSIASDNSTTPPVKMVTLGLTASF